MTFKKICLSGCLACAIVAVPASAQALKTQLETTFAGQSAPYLGYETVAHRPPGLAQAGQLQKYLVLDFRFAEPQSEQRLQASVHQICQAILLDQQLVQTLSADGYNRLAVAFDRESQYDCF